MIALFSGGGISGVLTHISSAGVNEADEHVLVLGFDDGMEPICISEDGHAQRRIDFSELILDWRWVNGAWLAVAEIEAAKGESDDEPAT